MWSPVGRLNWSSACASESTEKTDHHWLSNFDFIPTRLEFRQASQTSVVHLQADWIVVDVGDAASHKL